METAYGFKVTNGQVDDGDVQPTFTYPAAFRTRDIEEQVSILNAEFSGIGLANKELAKMPLPYIVGQTGGGHYAIPPWQKIAGTYSEATKAVLQKIASERALLNLLTHLLDPPATGKPLLEHSRSVSGWEKLAKAQNGYNIMVVPGQLGMRHRDRSVNLVREVFASNEFSFGVYANAITLLTHPERLGRWGDLWMDCAGDECVPVVCGVMSRVPYFSVGRDDVLILGARSVGHTDRHHGASSGCFQE